MKPLALLLLPLVLSGCVTIPIESVSTRSRDFTPALYENKGKVTILTPAKLANVYPTELTTLVATGLEEVMASHGYTIVETRAEADYALQYRWSSQDEGVVGYSYSGSARGSVYDTGYGYGSYSGTTSGYATADRMASYKVETQFREVKPGGGPGRLLWNGTSFSASTKILSDADVVAIFKGALEKFPN